MIQITDKTNCCGCGACRQVCPVHCIEMYEDGEGFLYPKANAGVCIDCGKCEQVCPVIHQGDMRNPILIYATKNKQDDMRMQSSSGGMFTLLAEKVIQSKGVVFGSCFDKSWKVIHDYTETLEGLNAFRGSKYVQSDVRDTYKEAEAFLKQSRKVLFSGTPCQIAGLLLFLQKPYDSLLTVEVICHGVPSPAVWRLFLLGIIQKYYSRRNKDNAPFDTELKNVASVSFRDKTNGWKQSAFVVSLKQPNTNKEALLLSEIQESNLYFKGFQRELYLRPACSHCCAKGLKSKADITLGDFWGIQHLIPGFDDDKGVSALLINTSKGESYFGLLQDKMEYKQSDYTSICTYNRFVIDNAGQSPYRQVFFEQFTRQSILYLIRKYTGDTTKVRFRKTMVRICNILKITDIIKKILR